MISAIYQTRVAYSAATHSTPSLKQEHAGMLPAQGCSQGLNTLIINTDSDCWMCLNAQDQPPSLLMKGYYDRL